jgi:hypothetical protein
MKKIFFVLLISFFTNTGFTQNFDLEIFELKTDTQTATFYIGEGWVGIGASMPVITENYRPKKLNGMDIYFDESYQNLVSDKLPGCRVGRSEIMIVAKIYLKERVVSVSTMPAQSRYIYEAIVIELKDIIVKATPCN